MSVGQILKAKRMKAGLTQKYIADKFGYGSAQFVSNWERDISMPPLESAKELGKMLNLNRDELVMLYRMDFERSFQDKIGEYL